MVVFVPSQDEDPDSSWLLLSEDDLIALFSQFPFDELFKHLLGMSSEGEKQLHLSTALFSNSHVLVIILQGQWKKAIYGRVF